MLLQIPDILSPEQVSVFRQRLDEANWIDGNVTSGHQSARAKYNEQLPEESATARELGALVMDALARSPLFFSAALPRQVFPPLFNRYRPGMTFGNHVDGAIRTHAASKLRIRTDLSVTMFLCDPDDYDGGDLVSGYSEGANGGKDQAGHLVI